MTRARCRFHFHKVTQALLAFWWCACALLVSTAPALAQPGLTPAARKARLAQAKALYKSGRSLFQQRRFGAAIPKFVQGVRLISSLEKTTNKPKQKKLYARYKLGFYATLGVAYQWQKALVEARRFYALCAVKTAPKRIQKICKRYLPEVQKQLAYISVESKPKKAVLLLRKRQGTSWTRSRAPYRGWRKPGPLHLQLSKRGYVSLQRILKLQAGVRFKVLYTLEKPSCPTPQKATTPVIAAQIQAGVNVTTSAAALPAMTALPQPFSGGGMPPWQLGLVVAGVAVGTAVLVGGVAAIAYGASHRRYVIQTTP